jgi:signal transduction histidine kinase
MTNLLPPSIDSHPDASGGRAWMGLDRGSIVAMSCVVLSLVSMLALAVWGVLRDFEETRLKLLQSDVNRLRSHAVRTVSVLQNRLADRVHPTTDLAVLGEGGWLQHHWNDTIPSDPARLYGAVVDASGRVVFHSDIERAGRHLADNWADRPVIEVGDDADVFETNDPALTDGRQAFDIVVPIFFNDREIGTYHSGFNCTWFDEQARAEQQESFFRWAGLLAAIAAIAVIAFVAVYRVARHVTIFRQLVQIARLRRLAEIGQLVAAIAHEIRNPLNAMRLNLHVLGRNARAASESESSVDVAGLIRETDRDIQRIEDLIKVLVGYVRPEQAHAEDIDAVAELRSTVDFLRPSLERAKVRIDTQLPDVQAPIHIDRNRLRQIILNLLNNAKEAAGTEGTIEVSLSQADGSVRIVVADDGPGIPDANRERIFEPFFTTKELGTGLGLPLVKRFVEEAGGTVVCHSEPGHGARFRIELPKCSAGVRPEHLTANVS